MFYFDVVIVKGFILVLHFYDLIISFSLNSQILAVPSQTSQVTYVTLVPRGNEMLRRNARGTPSALSSSESYV